jgi:hypothetical protein
MNEKRFKRASHMLKSFCQDHICEENSIEGVYCSPLSEDWKINLHLIKMYATEVLELVGYINE